MNKTILTGLAIILIIFGGSLITCQFITKNCSLTTSSVWDDGAFNSTSVFISNFGFIVLIVLIILSGIYLFKLGFKNEKEN